MYDQYRTFVKATTMLRDLTEFKASPTYRAILEHVSPEIGNKFLEAIETKSRISRAALRAYCNRNDSLGKPQLYPFGPDFEASPSSLRYVYHAHLILSHAKQLGLAAINMLEIGGGYGGLYLALDMFSSLYDITVMSYTIVDLPEVLELQRQVAAALKVATPLTLLPSTTFGADYAHRDAFLTSNYCFSTLPKELQKKYQEILFPKVAHGFIAWNAIPVFDFGFPTKIVEESPMTGDQFNKYVYF